MVQNVQNIVTMNQIQEKLTEIRHKDEEVLAMKSIRNSLNIR